MTSAGHQGAQEPDSQTIRYSRQGCRLGSTARTSLSPSATDRDLGRALTSDASALACCQSTLLGTSQPKRVLHSRHILRTCVNSYRFCTTEIETPSASRSPCDS